MLKLIYFIRWGTDLKIRMEFLLPILAEIESIYQQPAMSHWNGVQGCKPASFGVLERMAERSHGVMGVSHNLIYGDYRIISGGEVLHSQQ